MLLLVSTNPTVDRLIGLPHLNVSQVHRAASIQLSAGGKAINVARAARNLGVDDQLSVGFLAGHAGHLLRDLMAGEHLPFCWHFAAQGETKMSHLLLHEQGDTTVINEPGPVMTAEDWQAFEALVWEKAKLSRAVVLAGTIPPGVPAARYLDLCRRLTTLQTQVFIDTPGATLQAVLTDPAGMAIKVNRSELSQALGIDLTAPGKMVATLRVLIGSGAKLIGVTLGSEGAILADANGIYRTCNSPRPQCSISTVGSGDSFTAGLVTGYLRGRSLPDSLRLAEACGIANIESPQPAQFERERVETLMRLIQIEAF